MEAGVNSPSNNFREPSDTPIFFSERRVAERPVRSAGEERSDASILTCVEDEPESAAVVRHAIAVGRGLDLPITLAHVVETIPHFGRPVDPVDWQLQCNEHRDQLNQMAGLPSDNPIPIESVLLTGAAADSLSDWAIEHRVPLLALATHGHNSQRHNGLGATAQRILERAATSLLLVPPSAMHVQEKFMYRKVLVPLDGSCRAESVLPLASRIARAHDAEILLAHVVPKSAFVDSRTEQVSDLCAQLSVHNERRAHGYLDELSRKLRADGLTVTTILAPNGDARAELRRLAIEQQIDLIVLSSHGQSGLTDMPCGSVTEYLATHAPVPMLIVRPNFIHGFGSSAVITMPTVEPGPLPN
jgi:nucleotide-binding universal stress UspA family protein